EATRLLSPGVAVCPRTPTDPSTRLQSWTEPFGAYEATVSPSGENTTRGLPAMGLPPGTVRRLPSLVLRAAMLYEQHLELVARRCPSPENATDDCPRSAMVATGARVSAFHSRNAFTPSGSGCADPSHSIAAARMEPSGDAATPPATPP